MIYSGLDEAALGPRLGPFTACLVEFSLPEESPGELYDLLSPFVTPKADSSRRMFLADSKVLYSPSRGAALLETAALALLSLLAGETPRDFSALLRRWTPPEDQASWEGIPWFSAPQSLKLPWAASPRDIEAAAGIWAEAAPWARPQNCSLRMVPAAAFNASLGRTGNKALTTWEIIRPFIQKSSQKPGRLTVDRQGGRRYYAELLAEALPGAPLQIGEEGSRRSRYQIKEFQLEFLVQADSLRLETALASIMAKYLRESAMKLFNAYWGERCPGLSPTAGYPGDARRFLENLKHAKVLPGNLDLLVRRS